MNIYIYNKPASLSFVTLSCTGSAGPTLVHLRLAVCAVGGVVGEAEAFWEVSGPWWRWDLFQHLSRPVVDEDFVESYGL